MKLTSEDSRLEKYLVCSPLNKEEYKGTLKLPNCVCVCVRVCGRVCIFV